MAEQSRAVATSEYSCLRNPSWYLECDTPKKECLMVNKFYFLALLFFLPAALSYAHPGRTNSDGCHTMRATGEYHCHGGRTLPPPNIKGVPPATKGLIPIVEAKGNAFYCGAKRKCGEMVSCAEAKFYLLNCGLIRLDGDNDGIPCESLCGR
jgi:hypothetical protein